MSIEEYRKLHKILNSLLEQCNLLEKDMILDKSTNLRGMVREDLLIFLSKLAMLDHRIDEREIEFINEVFGSKFDKNNIKEISQRNVKNDIPKSIDTFARHDVLQKEFGSNRMLAQKVVNFFYNLGLEFVACDNEVSYEEVDGLTKILVKYQHYLMEYKIVGKPFDLNRELEKYQAIYEENPEQVSFDFEEEIILDKFFTDNTEEDEIKSDTTNRNGKDIYETGILDLDINRVIKEELLRMLNLIKIQKIREERGLRNKRLLLDAVLIGENPEENAKVTDLYMKILHKEGFIRFDVLNKFQPSGINSMQEFEHEMMCSDFELANGGIFFIEDADKLTKNEIGYLLDELKKSERAVILLGGATYEMIRFFEKNRELYYEFERVLYFNEFKSEAVGRILYELCTGNDYFLQEGAMECFIRELDSHTEIVKNIMQIFHLFDQIIEVQSNRLAAMSQMEEKDLSEIRAEDIEEALR